MGRALNLEMKQNMACVPQCEVVEGRMVVCMVWGREKAPRVFLKRE